MKIKQVIVAVLAAGQALAAGQVSAACAASNIAGTWYTHAAFFDYTGAGADWVRCKLVVGSTGTVSTTASQCRLSSGTALTVSAGALAVNTSCMVSGSVTTKRNGVTFGRMALQFGQMDVSYRSFSGLGYDSTRSQWKFMMHAVRQ